MSDNPVIFVGRADWRETAHTDSIEREIPELGFVPTGEIARVPGFGLIALEDSDDDRDPCAGTDTIRLPQGAGERLSGERRWQLPGRRWCTALHAAVRPPARIRRR